MKTDTNKIKSKIIQGLADLYNEVQPIGKSNIDPLLFDMFFAKEGKRFFDAHKKRAENLLKSQGFLDNMPEPGCTAVLASGSIFALQATVKRPASRLDVEKLKELLEAQTQLSKTQIAALFAAAMTRNKPAKVLDIAII